MLPPPSQFQSLAAAVKAGAIDVAMFRADDYAGLIKSGTVNVSDGWHVIDPLPPSRLPEGYPFQCTCRTFPGTFIVAMPWAPRDTVTLVSQACGLPLSPASFSCGWLRSVPLG